jgi:hypothetical protein
VNDDSVLRVGIVSVPFTIVWKTGRILIGILDTVHEVAQAQDFVEQLRCVRSEYIEIPKQQLIYPSASWYMRVHHE